MSKKARKCEPWYMVLERFSDRQLRSLQPCIPYSFLERRQNSFLAMLQNPNDNF
jgi:hypothetical protein